MSTKFRFKELFGGAALVAALAVGTASAESFSGFGQDIPLESAAKQIVPEGWSVDFGDGVDRKAAVSWSAASDWKSALSSAVARKGYTAQFGTSTVVIAKGGRVAQAPDAPKASPRKENKPPRTQAVAPSEPAVRRERPAKVAEEAPSKVGGGGFVMATYRDRKPTEDPKSDVKSDGKWRPYAGKATKDGSAEAAPAGFSVAEGDDLRNVIETWGGANGWKVVWDSQYNYPIAAAAKFDGDFVQAVSALVGAMSGARPSITVDFFTGNHVVVVSNKAADEAN